MIQDDTRVCANFAETIERIALRNADVPVCLFLASAPKRVATAVTRVMGKSLYYDARLRINEFCPVVGMLWPVSKAQEFLTWTQENPRKLAHREPRSDDSVAGRWCALTHQTIRFCVPSIVEHLGTEPSVKGGATAASAYNALFFTEDGSQHDW